MKKRTKVTKDAASRVDQEPHLCSNSDGELVKGFKPLVAQPDLYFEMPLCGMVTVTVG